MPPKKQKNTHVLAPPIAHGTLFIDWLKKRWRVLSPIGQGGFGAIYSCVQEDDRTQKQYAMKVEPKDNGPLFVEINFYQRAAKIEMVVQWIKAKKLSHLGIPKLHGLGSHEIGSKSLRFLVLDKFGSDIQKLFEQHSKFPVGTCYRIGLSLIDALEYLHEHEFVHSDIKGGNILLDSHQGENVFLLDYGLAFRFMPNGVHSVYKEDPKKAHDGTPEYTSLDAHKGVKPSRRSDLEILGYVLLHWMTGYLPWLKVLRSPENILAAKNKLMTGLPKSLASFPVTPDVALEKYLCYVKNLSYQEKPDYHKARSFFLEGIKRTKTPMRGKLIFANGCESEVEASPVRTPQKNGPKRNKSKIISELGDSDIDASGGEINKKKGRAKLASATDHSDDAMVTAESFQDFETMAEMAKSNRQTRRTKASELSSAVNDRQIQTSPWLYEEFRAERRKRRRAEVLND